MPKLRLEPHLVLALGAAVVVAAEYAYRNAPSDAWLLLQMAAAGAALVVAWREQERLRLAPLLCVALAFHLAYLGVHRHLDVVGDIDSRVVFRWQGNAILDGYYPRSEYPAGAVLLFALEAWLGGGATRWANALVMVPFQLATVAAVWACRTRWSAWLAALVALWPMNAFYWEFKFDLAPTALLAVGLVLALRGRWTWAGVALGAGAALKWTPALGFLVLLVYLLARERRQALRHALGFLAAVLVVYVPLVAWDANAVAAAYERQSGRPITAESVWYLPLHAIGRADVHGHVSFGAGAPEWANALALVVQGVVVLALIALAWRVARPAQAVALAALAPAFFLLLNRIFSPQFLVVVLASWAIAAALVVRTRREQLAAGIAAAVATAANAFVYPFALPHYEFTWQLASLTLFAVGLSLTAWLAVRARA